MDDLPSYLDPCPEAGTHFYRLLTPARCAKATHTGDPGSFGMATIVTRARSTGLEPELRTLADSEGTSCAKLARLVARGRVVVPKSVLRPDLTSVAIGEGMEVKVNANLGSSMDISDQGMEMEKAAAAVGAGAPTRFYRAATVWTIPF